MLRVRSRKKTKWVRVDLKLHEVKIIPFVLVHPLGNNLPQAEKLIEDYLHQGYRIVAAGGAGGDGGGENAPWANGFIVLHRDNSNHGKHIAHNGRSPNGATKNS